MNTLQEIYDFLDDGKDEAWGKIGRTKYDYDVESLAKYAEANARFTVWFEVRHEALELDLSAADLKLSWFIMEANITKAGSISKELYRAQRDEALKIRDRIQEIQKQYA